MDFRGTTILLCGFILLLGPISASASPLPEKEKRNKIAAFLKAAISTSVGEKNTAIELWDPDSARELFEPERLKKEYPWIYPYIYNTTGIPKFLVLNKWKKPVRISLGFPNDMKPFVGEPAKDVRFIGIMSPSLKIEDDTKSVVSDQIKLILPSLNEATNLSISYLPHEDETISNYAEIRVVLLSKNEIPDWIENMRPKHYPDFGHTYGGYWLYYFDTMVAKNMMGPVFFTQKSESEHDVYGYFLPDGKNNIQMSFCYIWQGHNTEKLKELVNECVVRSLGFPERLFAKGRSSIGYKREDPTKQPLPQPVGNITTTDKEFLGLLYSSQLKSGMNYLEVRDALKNILQ